MAAGVSEGALIVDTGINTGGFLRGAREVTRAVSSLRDTVTRAGQSMAQAGNGYAQALGEQARAARQMQDETRQLQERVVQLNREMDAMRRSGINDSNRERFRALSDELRGVVSRLNEVHRANKAAEAAAREAASSASTAARKTSDDIREVGEQTKSTAAEGQSAVGGLKDAFGRIASHARAAMSTIVKYAGGGAWRLLQKIASGAKNAAIQLAKLAGRAITGGIKTLARWLGAAAGAAFKLFRRTKQQSGGLKLSLKDILRYGFGIRSLFVLFNKLRLAVKESFESLSTYDPRVKASLGALSASLNTLKGSLAPAFAPILEAVTPALTALINLVTQAVNAIGMFNAALTGRSYYTVAQGISSIGTAASSATGSAKELKRELAGFDQLNILGAKNSGAGASGSSGKPSEVAYNNVPIDSAISDFVGRLRELAVSGDWEGIGQVLAEGLNNAFEHARMLVSWDRLGGKITEGVTAITGTINGMLTGVNWESIGAAFGEGITTIGRTINLALKKLDLAGVGQAIGRALNGLVDKVDATELGGGLARLLTAKLEVLASAVTTFKWDKVGEKLKVGFESFLGVINDVIDDTPWGQMGYSIAAGVNSLIDLNWGYVGSTLAKSFNGVLDAFGAAVKTIKWGQIGYNLADGLNHLILDFNWPYLAQTLAKSFNGVLDVIGTAVKTIKWGQIGYTLADGLNRLIRDFNWPYLGQTIHNAFTGVLDFGQAFLDTFDATTFGDKVRKAFEKIKWDEIAKKAQNLLKTAFQKIGGFFEGLFGSTNVVVNNASDIYSRVIIKDDSSLAQKIGKKIGDMLSAIPWIDILNGIKTAFLEAFGGFVEGLFGTENGAIIVTLGAAIAALAAAIPALFTGLKLELMKSILGLSGSAIGGLAGFSSTLGLFASGAGIVGAAGALTGQKLYDTWKENGGDQIIQESAEALGEAAVEYIESHEIDTGREYYAWGGVDNNDPLGQTLNHFINGSSNEISIGKELKDIESNQIKYNPFARTDRTSDREILQLAKEMLAQGVTLEEVAKALNLSDQHIAMLAAIMKTNTKSTNDNTDAQNDWQSDWQKMWGEDTADTNHPSESIMDNIISTARILVNSGGYTAEEVVEKYAKQGLDADGIKQLAKALNVDAAAILANTKAVDKNTDTTYDAAKDPFSGAYSGPTGKSVDWDFGEPPSVDVGIDFSANANASYKNNGLLGYLKQVFAPGTDAQTRVELVKKGWTDLVHFVGTNKALSALVGLVKNGWSALSAFVGTDNPLKALINLMRGNYTSLGSFVGTNNPLQALINLMRGNYTSLGSFVGTNNPLQAMINLVRGNYTSLGSFVGSSVSAFVNLAKGNYTSLSAFVGNAVSALVNLAKGNFTSLSQWIGSAVSVITNLTKQGSNWNGLTLSQWIGGAISAVVNLTKQGSNWSGQTLAQWIGNTISTVVNLTKQGSNWSGQTIAQWVGNAISVVTNLTKQGSNWSGLTIAQWIGGVISVITNLTKQGSNWAGQTLAQWIGGAVSLIANLTNSGANWNSNGYTLSKWIGGAVSLIANLTQYDSNWKTNGISKWFRDNAGSPTFAADLAAYAANWYQNGIVSWFGNNAGNPNFAANVTSTGSNWVKDGISKWFAAAAGVVTFVANLVLGTTSGGNNKAAGGYISASGKDYSFATGGAIMRSGRATWWNSVAKYASGTSRAHGTVFVAGEAGPEVLGHVNGRTEILNKSQLAQAIYGAVVAGMGQAVNALGRYLAAHMTTCANGIIAAVTRAPELSMLRALEYHAPALATGGVLPYEVAAQLARGTADLQGTLDANNEDLIQTIISVIGAQTAAIVGALQAQQRQGAPAGGLSAQQVINEINRRTMMGLQPLKGI